MPGKDGLWPTITCSSTFSCDKLNDFTTQRSFVRLAAFISSPEQNLYVADSTFNLHIGYLTAYCYFVDLAPSALDGEK